MPSVEAGAGALPSFVLATAPSSQVRGQHLGGSAGPRTCWVINDDAFGTMFSTCKGLGLQVLRSVDARLLQQTGQGPRVLLEELVSKTPTLLCGVLKSPATHVGTILERRFYNGE